MKTYKANISLNKKQLIDNAYNSHGYPITIEKDIYDQYNIGDMVLFASKFNNRNIYGEIVSKTQQPRSLYAKLEVEYRFIVNILINIEIIPKEI